MQPWEQVSFGCTAFFVLLSSSCSTSKLLGKGKFAARFHLWCVLDFVGGKHCVQGCRRLSPINKKSEKPMATANRAATFEGFVPNLTKKLPLTGCTASGGASPALANPQHLQHVSL